MSEKPRPFFMYEDRLYPTQTLLRERYVIRDGALEWRHHDHPSKRPNSMGHYITLKFHSKSRNRSYLHRDLLNIYVTGHINPRYPWRDLLTMYNTELTES